jgi:hypothetical protein
MEAKNQMLKELRREIDEINQTLEDERSTWSAKEGEYLIQIRAVSSKKTITSFGM